MEPEAEMEENWKISRKITHLKGDTEPLIVCRQKEHFQKQLSLMQTARSPNFHFKNGLNSECISGKEYFVKISALTVSFIFKTVLD